MNNMVRILVTGASGYIAKKLIETLLNEKGRYKIYGISRSVLTLDFPDYFHIQGDILQVTLPNEAVDIVIHLAQSLHYRDFLNQAEDIFQVNIQATLRLLEWARRNKTTKFIFSSTGNVYGITDKIVKEEDQCEPDSFYSTSKFTAELLIKQYANYFETIILRFFTIYGPGQKSMLIPNIIESILDGKKIVLSKGIGIQITPLYIDDLVKVLTCFIKEESVKGSTRLWNVCGDEKVSLSEIVKIMEKGLNKQANIEINNNNYRSLCGDNSKLKERVKINKFIGIEEGILRTINSLIHK